MGHELGWSSIHIVDVTGPKSALPAATGMPPGGLDSAKMEPMLQRKYLFPNVIELNYQAGRRLGVNVYLIDGGSGEYVLIDIGFEDSVDDIVELIRQMDFSLSKCQAIVATHADADHIQGLKRAKTRL